MSTERLLIRNGYGASFNNIYIDGKRIRKECKNAYGKEKIQKEINFYTYIIRNKVNLTVPTIYSYTDTSYTMEYLDTYDSLYKVFSTMPIERKQSLLREISMQLTNLHIHSSISITKEQFLECLQIETHTKILQRVAEVRDILNAYQSIHSVNGVVLDSFNAIMGRISTKIHSYVETLTDYRVCIIHGDCQFNNILYNPDNNAIAFIDPRGYYGNMQLYGIPEYDFAKIRFALSGYDVFDNMVVETLQIENGNLTIPSIFQIDNVFESDDIITVLTLSIWLGNAHCFKHQAPKAMFSYFYALYLATLYLR
jgi:hypothetical protein